MKPAVRIHVLEVAPHRDQPLPFLRPGVELEPDAVRRQRLPPPSPLRAPPPCSRAARPSPAPRRRATPRCPPVSTPTRKYLFLATAHANGPCSRIRSPGSGLRKSMRSAPATHGLHRIREVALVLRGVGFLRREAGRQVGEEERRLREPFGAPADLGEVVVRGELVVHRDPRGADRARERRRRLAVAPCPASPRRRRCRARSCRRRR